MSKIALFSFQDLLDREHLLNLSLVDADKNLDYREVVHVLIRRPNSSGRSAYQARQARQDYHPSVGVPNQECIESLVPGHERRLDLPKAMRDRSRSALKSRRRRPSGTTENDRCIAATIGALGNLR